MKSIVSCLVMLLAFSCAAAVAQDFRKVVEIVDEMETSLRQMVAKEQADRKTDVAALRLEIDRLRALPRGARAADTTAYATGTALDDIHQRLDLVEKRTEEVHTDLAQLSKAMSLLVLELKKSSKEQTAGSPIQH
jgi:hypothetical protein